METKALSINGIPAILWGDQSHKLYLYVHGMGGRKEEAETFAALAVSRGWQVLCVDLPEHGDRKNESGTFNPWHAVPELRQVMEYASAGRDCIALFANSIGAWFSLLAFASSPLDHCLFVSPILNMEKLIGNLMRHAGVTEERLEREKVIPIEFGQPLSWEYLTYVRANPVTVWNKPTKILYAGQDNLTDRPTVEGFVKRFGCELKVMENGEHWFHTPEQLDVLQKWMKETLEAVS
jgi:alpha-beta hydrolase superfamily lysophospholipase